MHLAQFHNELRVARQVSHKNVCRLYDLGEADGRRFLTMEYVDGEDLGSLLRRIGRFPQDRALAIARQLCAGVAAVLHAVGVDPAQFTTVLPQWSPKDFADTRAAWEGPVPDAAHLRLRIEAAAYRGRIVRCLRWDRGRGRGR